MVALVATAGHLVNAPAGPRVDWRINIVKGELVGGKLPVWVHVPLAQEQDRLLFGEFRIYLCQGHEMKSVVPRSKPREFPLIRNRKHVATVQVLPSTVATLVAFHRRRGLLGIADQPVSNDVFVELLGPKQAGIGLASDARTLSRAGVGELGGVELIGLTNTKFEDLIERWA